MDADTGTKRHKRRAKDLLIETETRNATARNDFRKVQLRNGEDRRHGREGLRPDNSSGPVNRSNDLSGCPNNFEARRIRNNTPERCLCDGHGFALLVSQASVAVLDEEGEEHSTSQELDSFIKSC